VSFKFLPVANDCMKAYEVSISGLYSFTSSPSAAAAFAIDSANFYSYLAASASSRFEFSYSSVII
jgi:hypothetical protein